MNRVKPPKRRPANKHSALPLADPGAPHPLRPLPEAHHHFLTTSVSRLQKDPRILGVAAGGSYLLNEIDEFSDLDLLVYIEPDSYPEVLEQRSLIAADLGQLVECFTGEHVGEPRLLICLFGPPLLHVDLKFVSMTDIQDKVENPVIIWERGDRLSCLLYQKASRFPQPDSVWIEKRFWTWVHYTATKIGRGELFEALTSIDYLRTTVLGPLLLQKHQARPQGLRKIERHVSPGELTQLKTTLADYETAGCVTALKQAIKLYRSLRPQAGNPLAEHLACEYLKGIEIRVTTREQPAQPPRETPR